MNLHRDHISGMINGIFTTKLRMDAETEEIFEDFCRLRNYQIVSKKYY